MKNILVIRTHRLGDILQLTPLLRGLKGTYPGSRIYFLTGRDFVPLLEGNRHVDAIIPVPEKRYRYLLKNKPERYPSVFNELHDLICELREKRFDLAVNRQYEWGALFACLVGARKISGGSYSSEKGFYFEDGVSKNLFDTIRCDRKANRRNLVDWACRTAGLPPGYYGSMYLCAGPVARKEAERLIYAGNGRPLVGVQIGAAKPFRRWGADNFADVIKRLINEKLRKVVLIGSVDERDLSESVVRMLGEEKKNLINLTGKTSLKTTAAVLEKCELLITGDTGPMHMAAAVGTPVLSLFFGAAYPHETGPYGCGHFVLYADVPCAPCLDPERCGNCRLCREIITPSVVMEAFEKFEAFARKEPVEWKYSEVPIKLLLTSRDEKGEQILVTPKALKNLQVCDNRPDCDEYDESYLPAILREHGDEIVRSFMEGEIDRGFTSFSDYLDQWLVFRDVLVKNGDFEIVRRLLRECLEALRDRDMAALMDAVEYGFKPLAENLLTVRCGSGGSVGDVR